MKLISYLHETVVVRSVLGDKIDVEKKLRDEAKKCKWFVLWFDNDPEGEYIAYEVRKICVQQNSEIIVKRARFSSLNPTAVDAAIKTSSLDDLNPCLLDAVAYRKEVDFKTGRVWTRFQSFLARKQIPNATNLTLSYGLCQSALLGIVVERFNQVAKPKAQKYNISFNDRGYGPKVTFTSPVWYDAKSKASKKLQSCSDEKATIVEVFVEITNKFHSPPVPLTTMELEKFAAKYFKMTPKQTMDTAEDLYTQGFINYPRTETDGFSMNTKELRSIVSKHTKHEKWGSYASDLLDSNKGLWRDPRACKHTDHSHPPIHPIKFSNRKESGWKDHHCVLYELIVRHFLACLSEDALVQKTTVEVDLAGQQFFATTTTLYKLGYRKVYHYESLFLRFSKFPPYTAGGELTPMDLIVKGSTYSSPQNLSDEDLLSRMQQERIGTDSTWHLLINTVIGRKYVERKFDGNTWRYEPTKLGLALFNGYDQMKLPLWKPEMRAKMEKQITMIKNGTATKKDCLRDTG